MGASGNEKISTLDELIREKEADLKRLHDLKLKRMEIQFFRGIASVANSVAAKLENAESLGSVEIAFRKRMYEGLTVTELLSLLFDRIFRRRKAVIFTPEGP